MGQWADRSGRIRIKLIISHCPTEGIMDENSQDSYRQYEPPELRALGTVADLTQVTNKNFGGSDGLQFMGINIPVHTVSP
jgi:hypothetical protein